MAERESVCVCVLGGWVGERYFWLQEEARLTEVLGGGGSYDLVFPLFNHTNSK